MQTVTETIFNVALTHLANTTIGTDADYVYKIKSIHISTDKEDMTTTHYDYWWATFAAINQSSQKSNVYFNPDLPSTSNLILCPQMVSQT